MFDETDYIWISCGLADSRLELSGAIEQPDDQSNPKLISIAALRLMSYKNASEGETIAELELAEYELEFPISYDEQNLTLKDLGSSELVLAGPEGTESPFMDMMEVSGWQLILTKEENEYSFQLHLISDWHLDSATDYLPGNSFGEVAVEGTFGGAVENDFTISIPWPMSGEGTLKIGAPSRSEDRWSVDVDPRVVASLFDGAGSFLKDFPLGSIDLSSIADKVEEFASDYEKFISLEIGIDALGRMFYDIRIGPPKEFDIAEFGGLKLALLGDAALVLSTVFAQDHLELTLRLFLSEKAGMKLHGPFIRKVEGALEDAKEIMAMLPIEGLPDVPEFPDLQISFELGQEPLDLSLVSADIPLTWDFLPSINPVSNFLSGLPLKIDPSQLVGFKFGNVDGEAPKIEMVINKADFYNEGGVYGVDFEIQLNIKIDENDPFPLIADWLFTLDTETMSFNPAAALKMSTTSKEFSIAGLTVTGLDTLMVSFEDGNLTFTAERLRAYYSKISEGEDGGFEMEVSNLLIDGGGIDLDFKVVGGVTKISGIGESFKGAEGYATFKRSKFQSGYIKAEGPLPWLDNATGSLAIVFKEGFALDRVVADFQLGIHHKTDWWVELDLKSVNIDIHFNDGKPSLILMVTGKISIAPPAGSDNGFILSYFKAANLEFKDLVLTKAFDKLPPEIELSVVLTKPISVDLLGVFGFEMRSIGISSGFEEGQAAITIGGQVYFSSKDLQNKDPEFHKFKVGNPKADEIIPRIAFENLGLDFSYKPSLKLSGKVAYMDTPVRKGFMGNGTLTINKTISISVILEFVTVTRESDGKKLRVWMVYAEQRDVDANLIGDFYLRDIGVGFGWRKTLHAINDPTIILNNPSQETITIGPHLPTSWTDDLEGDKARWTVVLSSWLTYGLDKRTDPSPLVGDVLLGLRSDLTILISLRGWVFGVLDELKKGTGGLRPSVIGLLYYSARNRHLLATYVVDPSAATPKGVPPAVVQALIKNPFSMVLETKPGMFRLELGWPRQLSFPLGTYTGKAGFLMRTTPSSLTIGVGFEIAIDHQYSFGIPLGIGSIDIFIKIYIGVYGMILARIGNLPALYGVVGIDAIIIIALRVSINFKIGWFRIRFSFGFSITIVISARVDFGISDAGFGMEGYAHASLRVWKFSVGAQVSFAINKPALIEARNRVFEGVTFAGDEDKPLRFLPEPLFTLPAIKKQTPQWRAMPVRKGKSIYLLLLPEEDSWFACPDGNPDGTYKVNPAPDYQLELRLKNLKVEKLSPDGDIDISGDTVKVDTKVDWNRLVKIRNADDEAFKLGDLFYEPLTVQKEHQLIDQVLEDTLLQPELIRDWRVRTEEGAKDGMNDDVELRKDVRSPKFSADGSIYDLALEEAFKYGKDDLFSWQALALAQTKWTEDVINKPEVLEFLIGQGNPLEPADPNQPKQVYARRKQLLDGFENMRSIRGGLIGTLLGEYNTLINSSVTYEELEILAASGLALKLNIADETDFSLSVKSLKVNRGYGNEDIIKASKIHDGSFNNNSSEIGIDRERYRIKDLLEFQDEQGIHFSWELEGLNDEGESIIMTERESSGLQEENKQFEYFDHFLVERQNLSSESQETGYAKWEAKPGFVPSMLDIGDGNRNFYLVVPRFDFSDMFQVPADTGDQLLYRFTAVDIFGNYSETLEYLTSKKHLETPPPPDKIAANYQVDLDQKGSVNEQLALSLSESEQMANWSGSHVRYEIWASEQPLAAGGYYGLGDDVEDLGDGEDRPIVSPTGMTLIQTIDQASDLITFTDLSQFSYGKVYTFYGRAITQEGNASRLIRSGHTVQINDQEEKPQPHLERIPPYSNEGTEWISQTNIQGEVLPNLRPALETQQDFSFTLEDSGDKLLREVSVKLLHTNHVDDEFIYPTGGYEVYVRDRDITTDDDISNYHKQAEIEVLSPFAYGKSPYNTAEFSKWKSNFQSSSNSELSIEGYLDWGEPVKLEATERINGFKAGLLLHARLEELLFNIQEWSKKNESYVLVHGGGVSPKEIDLISFDKLVESYDPESDPYGSGLLRWMGRTVDFAVYSGGGLLPVKELIDLVISSYNGGPNYVLTLELLLNSDRQTPMHYYRVGVHPVVKPLSTHSDPQQRKLEREAEQTNSLNAFKGILELMLAEGKSVSGFDVSGILDRYMAFVDRFPKTRGTTVNSELSLGVSWFREEGDIARTVDSDDTISFQQIYKEPLARRFAYRVRRVGRYFPLYEQLGFVSSNLDRPDEPALLIRLPRLEKPRSPAIEYLGNHTRNKIQSSEWLIREHEEEAMVQSNETLRNRLGFRSTAWSLQTVVKSGWSKWSGWEGDVNWLNQDFSNDPTVDALSNKELNQLTSDAKWLGDSSLKSDATLHGHPFTELLEPKGLVIRVPELPYYYRYRLNAFVRADDVDSKVKQSDFVQSTPSKMPTLEQAKMGWKFGDESSIQLWWKIPSVWESINNIQVKIWQNEEPFASRLWDFDLKFTIRIRRQGVVIPLAYVQAEPLNDPVVPDSRDYVVTTAGSYLYGSKEGKVEKLNPIALESKFNPLLKIQFNVSEKLLRWMSFEPDFVFELVCTRTYGDARLSTGIISNKTLIEV